MKTKVKFYGDEVTDFYDKEITEVDCNHTCSAVIRYCYFKIKSADYCCIISGIGKNEAVSLMENINFTKKSRTL